jgi:hypothetical protein
MPFFSNKRKDFSIQPPKQEVSSIPFFVTDSSNIDFTFLNNNLTADLTLTGVVARTYGDASNIPVLQIDQFGRITGVTTVAIGGGGGISGTPTRIPFFDTASSLADDPLLYWDDVNKALIVGASSTPSAAARLYLFSSTNNADVFIETVFNQRLKFKNTFSGVQWHTSTNVFQDTPGNPRDSYNIGQSSNPALGYLEILKSGRVKIGSNIAGTLGFTDSVMLELGLTGVRGGQMLFNSLTSGSLLLKANDTTTPYTFTFPDDAGLSGEVLKTDGLGNTYWDVGGGGGGSQLNEPTGILFGGNLSASIGGTTFDLTAGIGQIVTQTSTISGVSTTVTPISWSAATAVPITNISTAPFTYVLIDNTGTIIQQTTPFTDAQYKTHIVIGIVCHIDLATVNLVTNTQNVAYQDPYRLVEMIRLFGPIKKTGMAISANGANLRVDRTAGEVFKIGSNYTTAAFEPDVDTISAATPAQLCRVHRNGSGGFVFDTNGGSFYTDIEPDFWDDGSGTLQGVPSNRWTIQRLFMFPNNPNDIICYYGIQLYNNFSEARAGVEFEAFDEAQITAENAVFLGYLFVRHNATDLSDPNEAAFLQSGLFRGIPPGGGGSGGGTLLLETNGVANGDQTVLNLIEGTGIDISDDGLGGVTITSTQLTNIYATFDTGVVLSLSITIDIDNIGTYSSASFTGGMTSATYTVNATPDTLPFTLVIGDVLEITPDAAGQIKLSGII